MVSAAAAPVVQRCGDPYSSYVCALARGPSPKACTPACSIGAAAASSCYGKAHSLSACISEARRRTGNFALSLELASRTSDLKEKTLSCCFGDETSHSASFLNAVKKQRLAAISLYCTGLVLESRKELRWRRDVSCNAADDSGWLVPLIDSEPAERAERAEHAKEWIHQTRRIVLFVEPSPFAYVCGYKNRFQNFIRSLREMGDEVLIVTTDKGVPSEFHGAKVVGSWSFQCPWYENLFLSLALSPRIYGQVKAFKPDIIHASSPGVMVFGALVIAKLLKTPIVMSYHTHVPLYIPKYTFSWLATPMWWIIRFLHRAADWTLVVSQVLGKELRNKGAAAADRIGLWSKGVDSDVFNPRFKNFEKRVELTNGRPEAPLIVHVGRLGAEKNLDFLKQVMQKLPEAHLAFVGDGPYRKELEKLFAGTNVTFTGMLSGEELSQAYSSGDVFITPSETETLGFVVLEAMASGVPVVAARAGGIIDIITKEGETGFLYSPGDLDDCVSKLKALLESPELRDKIAKAGREEVENFDWKASTRQVRNEMYTSAVWFWSRGRANKFPWLWGRPRQGQQPALTSP